MAGRDVDTGDRRSSVATGGLQ